jgi:hypothetical protein
VRPTAEVLLALLTVTQYNPQPYGPTDLTVPQDRLPAGCQLETRSTDEGKRFPLGLPTNPWWGTDPELVARVQAMAVGAAPAVGNNRPTVPTTILASEAYAAFYQTDDPADRAAVFAVRFDAPEEARLLASLRGKGMTRQVGPFTVTTSGPPRTCWQAVMAHLSSLAK